MIGDYGNKKTIGGNAAARLSQDIEKAGYTICPPRCFVQPALVENGDTRYDRFFHHTMFGAPLCAWRGCTMTAAAHDTFTPALSPNASQLEAALYYAREMGWRVFPVQPEDKTPYATKDVAPGVAVEKGKGGFHLATADPATITRWFTRWPTALIGVPIEGWCVVEADVRAGGDVALKEFCDLHDIDLDNTVRATSASGGPHYYFRDVPGLRRAIGFVPGVDFLASGAGFVGVAPSRRKGGQYQWVPGHAPWECAMAEMPTALREAIEQSSPTGTAYAYKSRPAGYAGAPRSRSVSDPAAYVQAAFYRTIDEVSALKAGQRREGLNRLSFALGQFVGAGHLSRTQARDGIAGAFKRAGHPLDAKAEETIDVGLDDGAAQPITLVVEPRAERSAHQENNGHQENNAGDASTGKTTAPEDTPRRVYWTGPSPFNAVLRDEVGWGALVLRVYDAICGKFGVVMGEPYPDGERPAPRMILGKALAHETEDKANSVNAALTALTDGHYLTREIERERDAGGRTRRTWYVYGLPLAGAWDAWCDDPTLFAAPPPLRTAVASAAYRAEHAELRKTHKAAVLELAAATTAHVEDPDDPTLFAAVRVALDAYNEATAALAPRKRGRPSRESRQGSPTMADDGRCFSGETVTVDEKHPQAAASAHQENNGCLPFSKEQVNNRCFPGDEDPFAAASAAADTRCFPGEGAAPEEEKAAHTATSGRCFPGERPANDYLGGASSPPEVKMHHFERLMRRAAPRPTMPDPGGEQVTREYMR